MVASGYHVTWAQTRREKGRAKEGSHQTCWLYNILLELLILRRAVRLIEACMSTHES